MNTSLLKFLSFILLFATASILPVNVSAQAKYFIGFTDKQNSTYSVDKPNEFLSARAIERRQKQGIAITTDDLPVSSTYINQVAQIATTIHYPLRWFNGVVATLTPQQLTAIQELSFVKSVTKVFEPTKSSTDEETDWQPLNQSDKNTFANLNYGASYTQVAMMNGHILHGNGYLGDGMVIAVLDAGFLNANTHSAFDSLWQRGRILGARDFVNPQSDIYKEHYHGTMVLSAMGGYIDGQLIGTAPRANYWLIRTEDAATEQIIEEYNWAAGAEFADSVGADIINSSLGYTTFDVASQNHTYQDLNGNTAPVTLAANMAASKGMVVVVSAGNDGNAPWHYISVPADSPNVLTVGAVDNKRVKADFSSFGPTADGRIKPDVCAMGKGTVLAIATGTTGTSNGTSFSSPLMAGMVACLWQAKPSLTAQQIVELVKSSSSSYASPNNNTGYGIPDFAQASTSSITDARNSIELWPNPFTSKINILLGKSFIPANISIFTTNGQLILTMNAFSDGTGHVEINISEELPKGIYLLSIDISGSRYYVTGIKQ
ncbi:MAG TPA: S8 family serine peptidase [Tenuifilum sp.]|uniref:S8 family serine peptidase n=1 Tax=Tenuifilum sp. TaxID=2760880 RepID=UPI002B81130F|nr:S8 family serine peptidase [Tenuifilum sp.]